MDTCEAAGSEEWARGWEGTGLEYVTKRKRMQTSSNGSDMALVARI